jgi:hypothetical protein
LFDFTHKRNRANWSKYCFVLFFPLLCKGSAALAYESSKMLNARMALSVCAFDRRIIYMKPSQQLSAMGTECRQQQIDYYRSCRDLGRDKEDCLDDLAQEELDILIGR